MAKRSEKKSKSGGRRREQVTPTTARKFLESYKEAWETHNPELAASLFTRDAHYWENPFGEPIVGREAICCYWKAATHNQENIQFTVRNAIRTRYALIAEWTCKYRYRPSGERRELAGTLLADFYGKQARSFREYWHRRAV